HRDVTVARKPWDEQRGAFGLPENLSVADSLLMSQRILEARRRWLEWQAVIRPGELQRTALDSFERRIQETARQWDVKLLPGQSLAEQQAALEKQLAAQQKESQERRSHQETLRQLRRAEHQAVSE